MSQTTWIVVANGFQAKIYRLVRFPQIEEVAYMEHPASRLHNKELVSAAPGRAFASVGTTRHAYEAKTDPHHHEVETFARTVSHFLSNACAEKEYSRLYLFASPSFLGMLRPLLDLKTKETLVAEVPKDLTEFAKGDIEKQLTEI